MVALSLVYRLSVYYILSSAQEACDQSFNDCTIGSSCFYVKPFPKLPSSLELAMQQCYFRHLRYYLPVLDSVGINQALGDLLWRRLNCSRSRLVFWLGLVRREPVDENERTNIERWRDPKQWRWLHSEKTLVSFQPGGGVPWKQVEQTDKYRGELCVIVEVRRESIWWTESPCYNAPAPDDETTALLICQNDELPVTISQPLSNASTTDTNASEETNGSSEHSTDFLPVTSDHPGVRVPQTSSDTEEEKLPWQWLLLSVSLAATVICLSAMTIACVLHRRAKRKMKSDSTPTGRRSSSIERSDDSSPIPSIMESTHGRKNLSYVKPRQRQEKRR